MRYSNKKDGFKHEKLIVLPEDIRRQIAGDPITSSLYTTDIGYFPKAKDHYRTRPTGSDHHILLFCVDGEGTVIVGKTQIALKKNHLLIIPAGEPHQYYADTYNPWTIYWLHYGGRLATHFTHLLQPEPLAIPIIGDKHSALIQLFTTIFIQLELGYSKDHLIHITGLLHLFFSTILQNSTTGYKGSNKASHYTSDIISYMQDNIHSTLTLKALANNLNLSPSYLTHYFKEKTGYAPIDYFIQMKVQKACHLLDTKDLYIKEIALELGYSDPYYFSRVFKRIMKMSPKAYKEIEKG